MTDGNPRFTLRLEQSVIDGLKALAQEQGRTPSELIREEVLKLLDHNGIDYKSTRKQGGGKTER